MKMRMLSPRTGCPARQRPVVRLVPNAACCLLNHPLGAGDQRCENDVHVDILSGLTRTSSCKFRDLQKIARGNVTRVLRLHHPTLLTHVHAHATHEPAPAAAVPRPSKFIASTTRYGTPRIFRAQGIAFLRGLTTSSLKVPLSAAHPSIRSQTRGLCRLHGAASRTIQCGARVRAAGAESLVRRVPGRQGASVRAAGAERLVGRVPGRQCAWAECRGRVTLGRRSTQAMCSDTRVRERRHQAAARGHHRSRG